MVKRTIQGVVLPGRWGEVGGGGGGGEREGQELEGKHLFINQSNIYTYYQNQKVPKNL